MRLLQNDAPDVAEKVTQMLAADRDDPLTAHDVASEATWADAFREHGSKPKSATAPWHFVDIEIDGPAAGDLAQACAADPLPSGTPASDGPAKSCVTRKIKEFKHELGDAGTTAAERLLALKFLLHFVGDVHQPLHAADHANADGKPDRGGNCVGVLPGHNTRPIKLHSYWDTTVVTHALSGHPQEAAETVFAMVTPEKKEAWRSTDPDKWAPGSGSRWRRRSSTIFRPHLNGPASNFRRSSGGREPCGPVNVFRLTAEYEDRAEQTASEQIAKAAVRLAFVLEQQLD